MYKIDTKPKKTEAEKALFECAVGMLFLLCLTGLVAIFG